MADERLLDKVKGVEKTLEPLRQRMDKDMTVYYLEKFVLVDSKNKPIPHADNVTLNDPRTFADRVINILGGAKRRFTVRGKAEVQTAVEGFMKELYSVNDEVLEAKTLEDFEFTLDFFATLRGWMMARVLMYKNGGRCVPEIIPIDPRYGAWQVGNQGLDWGSYRISMSPLQINQMFGREEAGEKEKEVLFVWTRDEYCAYLGDQQIQTTSHELGVCPIIVVPTPTHPPSLLSSDANAIKYRGESIYAANREVYAKLNDFASVWATINKMTFLSPIAFLSPQGRRMTETPFGIGVVISLKDGEKFVPIPTKELSQSAQVLFGQLFAGAQRGSLPNVDYGELSFELSAVAISKLTESRNVVFQPRLKAKSRLLAKAGRLALTQYLGEGYDVKELAEELPDLIVDKKNLNEPFRMTVDYHAISPEQNVANYTIAQAAKTVGLSDRTIFSEVLMLEDPEGEIRLREREYAEKEVPEVRLYHYAVCLLEEYERTKDDALQVEATLVANRLGMIVQGTKLSVPGEKPEPETEPVGAAASQPAPGVKMPGMPGMAGQHVVREGQRRLGIEQEQRGKNA